MDLIDFSKANCRSCYKCVRSCPVKAIRIKNDQAKIVSERCVACGQCLVTCPQNARNIKSDLYEIKKAISSDKKTIAIVAPSFSGAFQMDDELKMVAALKKLGFNLVEEVAVGADVVSELYKNEVNYSNKNNLITTCCPAVNFLIRTYYPSLIEYMIPVDSPMITHGKLLKTEHGNDCFITFIGPCTAKKFESVEEENRGIIDSVLTFDELSKWLEEENIDISSLEPDYFNRAGSKKGRLFPVTGRMDIGDESTYDSTVADGIDRCMEMFQAMENGEIKGIFLEALACRGGCIGGPAMPKDNVDFYVRQKNIKKYIRKSAPRSLAYNKIPKDMNFTKVFTDLSIKTRTASEDEILNVLRKMGKYDSSDELNCGACGYNTCREKAQALIDGMAEINMCIHYVRNKAEGISNMVFETSPNAIFTLDEDLLVKDFNPASESLFKIKYEEIKDKPICMLIDDSSFYKVKETNVNIIGNKAYYPNYNLVVLENIIHLEKQGVFLVIINDITMQEKNKEELAMVKEKTLDAAQKVIEKQMRVAQEIASLLGETTAETKAILTKLKAIALEEVSDRK